MGEEPVMAPTQIAATVRTRIAARTRSLTQYLFDSYRPERHYMRGPGPKWHEKHGETVPANVARADFPTSLEARA